MLLTLTSVQGNAGSSWVPIKSFLADQILLDLKEFSPYAESWQQMGQEWVLPRSREGPGVPPL